MKINFMVLTAMAMIIGCSGVQINDDASTNAIAHISGKGIGIAISSYSYQLDTDLSDAWVELLKRNENMREISSQEMILFFNRCAGIVAQHAGDRYGLLEDLAVMLTIFGAQYGPDGDMTFIKPVPLIVMKYFENGYISGRRVGLQLIGE